MRRLAAIAGFLALALIMAAPANADTIVVFNNGNGCGGSNCFGTDVTVTIHPVSGNNYTVTLQVDFTGYTGTQTGVGGVDFKFSNAITAATLTSFNGGSAAGWTTAVTNGLNANGCTVTGGSSFGCSKDTAFLTGGTSLVVALASLPHGGTYTWVWDVTAGAWNPATDAIHAGVLFGSESGGVTSTHCTGPAKKQTCTTTTTPYTFSANGIISASGLGTDPPPPNNPVPEPGSLALLGTGLVGVAGMVRRRFVK